jgi:hypothetical protein
MRQVSLGMARIVTNETVGLPNSGVFCEGACLGDRYQENEVNRRRCIFLASLSGLLPTLIVTAFLLVNGCRLRSGMPGLMWGQSVLAFAIVVGEIFVFFGVPGIAARIISLLFYPVLAYIGLNLYFMLFGAVFFRNIPW